ncbi:MAG: PAS domain S-box-containing protein [Candidatus Azotimanducaceae bacterium]|jgi:PAS domain S-box-containing protein
MKKTTKSVSHSSSIEAVSKDVASTEATSKNLASKEAASDEVVQTAAKIKIPIVGIGASAGGLEALEEFFSHVPASPGVAFVVIQHLDPTHKGIMPELLQRATLMKVTQAGNRMKVEPNCVYVIPPNKDLSILHGDLFLLDPTAPRGLRLPIDFFLRSLAADQRERAVGVILSGMGSDGTLGMRAIKENAGVTLVQLPESAKYDSMPRSVINAGLADITGLPKELPDRLIGYLNHTPRGIEPIEESLLEPKSRSALEQIVILLRDRTGNDFSLYKNNTINRRIERRMGLHQIDSTLLYTRYLRENPQELDLLFKELLIGVTNFFRDPAEWEQLRTEALPALLAKYPAGKVLRAWVPACSTGEEAYSLAMIFKETLDFVNPSGRFSLQIFATDLDDDAIEKARLAFYPANIEADVTPERLARFFTKDGDGYRISKDIREMVIFAPQNIIMDPPFTRLDILTCRNLLIYLGPELQKRLIPLFHYALTTNGILLLGSAETTGNFTSLFAPRDKKSRLYNRLDNPVKPLEVDFPARIFPVVVVEDQNDIIQVNGASTDSTQANSTQANSSQADSTQYSSTQYMTTPIHNLQALADQVLLQNYSPAAAMINSQGDILYINGRTGKYLEPASGKANWNIYAMARDGLRHELGSAIPKALSQEGPVRLSNLLIGTNGGTQTIDLTVEEVISPASLQGSLMVVFTDVLAPVKSTGKQPTRSASQKALQEEIQLAHQQIQSLREEMQSSQEELKSANEELQSTNEELQSTNEELTTSKEEMQSLNEELQTVNTELQSKVEDLSWVNNDMENLLNSTEIATVFLNDSLHVRRFTDHATHLFKLIPSDVGRPLSDITTNLDYAGLQADAREVLRTLVFIEKQVSTKDGRWFKVRIMPYRTMDNVIDGVVITFLEVSSARLAENELFSSRQMLRTVLDNIPQRVFWKDRDSVYLGCNRSFAEDCGQADPAVLVGKTDFDIYPTGAAELCRTSDLEIMESGQSKLMFDEQQFMANGSVRWLSISKIPLHDTDGQVVATLGTYEHITEPKPETQAKSHQADVKLDTGSGKE